MFILRKQFNWEAAHFLPLVAEQHQCRRMHGHSYSAIIEVGSEDLEDGFVIDFAEINRYIKPTIKQLDHQLMNDFIENPSSENICSFIAKKFLKEARTIDLPHDKRSLEDLSRRIYLLAVEVSETPKTKCRLELKELL